MLQQTRVAAVLEHYRKFLNRFPTVRHLAAAKEPDVLAAWSGLGYYRRARMLHCAAKQLVAGGAQLPRTTIELQQLPGIGRYTGNAIASIAFGEAVAVVDGNVERVLSRVMRTEVSGQRLWTAAQDLLDCANAGDFNQAMMDLGATICTPTAPSCKTCPIRNHCASENLQLQTSAAPEERQRRRGMLLLRRRRNMILLQRRSERESLMPGMWELPQLASAPSTPAVMRATHSITVTDWRVEVFESGDPEQSKQLRWMHVSRLDALPLTGLTRKILRKLKLLA